MNHANVVSNSAMAMFSAMKTIKSVVIIFTEIFQNISVEHGHLLTGFESTRNNFNDVN